jgi:uncharacterized phiE125 gp8 family phage protein
MIELAELKAALRIPAALTEHDDYLTALERAAVAYVERRTGWYWGPQQEATALLEGNGTWALYLPDHASEVVRVAERSRWSGTETELPPSSYELVLPPGETHGLKLSRRTWEPWAYGVLYAVTYTRGYAAGEEPADIRQAVAGLVAHWFEHRLPVAAAEAAQSSPDHVAAILAARRKAVV